jgi:hypothetical protein
VLVFNLQHGPTRVVSLQCASSAQDSELRFDVDEPSSSVCAVSQGVGLFKDLGSVPKVGFTLPLSCATC